MTYVVENFNSLKELIKANETRKPNKVFAGKHQASDERDSDRDSFTRTKSYAEAVELMRNGYAEPLEKIKRGVEANMQGMSAEKTAVKNDIVGYAPCVPNAILGIPQSMINKELTVKKSKILTIIHDATSNCDTSTETFIKAGIATLTIVNSLEKRGYRVSLRVAFKNSRACEQRTFATVTVKDWRQPLDLQKMTFPFCHPSMLRRIGFKWLETTPRLTERDFAYGYGRSLSGVDSYEDIVKELTEKHLIADNEKYINLDLCKRKEFDAQEIARACGLEI